MDRNAVKYPGGYKGSNKEIRTVGVESDRIFKKSSPNSKLTVYIGKRDFVDYIDYSDPIDGVIHVDPDYIKSRKVFGHVVATFRYGREDLDVMGLDFKKELFVASCQIYPPVEGKEKPLTKMQERLMKKLGNDVYPFFFELPATAPASVTLQPAPADTGKPCGVDYELKTYVADKEDENPQKRNSVSLAIRKLVYAPEEPGPQPCGELTQEPMIGSGAVRLEASLEKDKYYHGEPITISVMVDNNSSRNIKKIRVSIWQYADICLFSTAQYKCIVSQIESSEGFPVRASQAGFCKVYQLTPLITYNQGKRGLALDGKLKLQDTNLASSTISRRKVKFLGLEDSTLKETIGIVVQYRIQVKLVMGFGASDVILELPFTLTHPKPKAPEPVSQNGDFMSYGQMDMKNEDDFIFEDFARLRLKDGFMG